ncbi:hypothetical protein [Phocicoccus pinnipedialis]|uniref:ABC-2 type transporter domain-containing protein n=1 Tax=Phocicoccus pinnipedialis TaxID=110845 RepID=A0A6V7RP08_9BACL|nr:hypothetical protein [Jeotgalicoccus pinnipedialis]MBP1940250.1 ABC-type polysaccharide/polyol phosphate export permease [Jeotgalicoccus pinnipedialis]CAD2079492.1 hypothetical protein JEOPIN946_01576 [Jeotgalicoccus pinnipedialis]
MNQKSRFLIRESFGVSGRNIRKVLLPTALYTAVGVILFILSTFLEDNDMVRITYTAVGLITVCWLYSSTILNQYALFKKDSVIKVNYIPMYFRVLPTIFYQTVLFMLFVILYSALVSLKTGEFMLHTLSLFYYLVIGIVLIIPFIILYIQVSRFTNTKIANLIVLVVLLLVTPVFYVGDNLPNTLENILLLNPFYYVIESIQLSSVGIPWSLNRLPQDVLFISEMLLVYLWIMVGYKKLKVDFIS